MDVKRGWWWNVSHPLLFGNWDSSCFLFDLKVSAQTVWPCCLISWFSSCSPCSLLWDSSWIGNSCWSTIQSTEDQKISCGGEDWLGVYLIDHLGGPVNMLTNIECYSVLPISTLAGLLWSHALSNANHWTVWTWCFFHSTNIIET